MVSVILLGIVLVILLYKLYDFVNGRPENFPPGPPRLPIIGGYIFLLMLNFKHLHKAALKLSNYYKSSIIGFYGGNKLVIVANEYKYIREILNRSEFDGKPDGVLARLRDPHFNIAGVFFTHGIPWREQRRFLLRHLRDWGFGRRCENLENTLRDEIQSFIELLKDGPKFKHETHFFDKDKNILCPNIFFATLGNSFFTVLYGERQPRSHQEILYDAGNYAMNFQRNSDDYGKLFTLIPWLRFVFPNLSGYNTIKKSHDAFYKIIKKIVDKQIETYNENNERHVIDLYIKKMKEAEAAGDKETSFHYDNLVMGCTDFSFPPLSAVAQVMTFIFQRIFLYPDEQIKVQKEIDDVVGFGRLPHLDDRINLPYTEAFIRENLRHETLVPSNLPHLCTTTTELGGYTIPKDTIVMTSLYAAHNDKTIWDEPEKFKPERFLDENGKFNIKKDKSLPFGAGKRLCAGETFARNILFLYISAILQNFTIVLPDRMEFPDLSKNITGLLTYTPDPFYIKLIPR